MAIFELLDYIVNEVGKPELCLCVLKKNMYIYLYISCKYLSNNFCVISAQPPPKLPHGVFTADFQDFVTKW